VTPRLSPVERIRAQIDELFASEQDLAQVLEQVARLSVRLVMQAAVEAEVSEFLGRERYARGDRERVGYRNGHTELTVRPPLTGGAGAALATRHHPAVTSRLLGKGVSRTNALEALVVSGFVRGLSVRDVEAALAEALGPEAALSKSTVSRVCEAIKDEFDAWKQRDLSSIELEYLYLDGSHFRMYPALGPSRGASPSRAVRCWSGWHRAAMRATTPGPASWASWWTAACARRCW
jgi:putative transposase